MQKVYVVQSVSTGDFLYLSPETGDIGHTKLITNADYFYDFEEAINAGLEEIGNQYEFVVFGFLKDWFSAFGGRWKKHHHFRQTLLKGKTL